MQALAARPAMRLQLGEDVWRQLLTIAADPRKEIVERQDSILLITRVRPALWAIHDEEPTLRGEVERIIRLIGAFRESIGYRAPGPLIDIDDTREERRGHR